MLRKQLVFSVFALISIACIFGGYAYTSILSESERCIQSIQIEENFAEVRNRLEKCGFVFVDAELDDENPETGRWYFLNENDKKVVILDVENKQVSGRAIYGNESVVQPARRWLCNLLGIHDNAVPSAARTPPRSSHGSAMGVTFLPAGEQK